jgi:epsilon-lactone hydrolase
MSLQMRAVAAYLRLTSKPQMATPERTRRLMARPKGPSGPPRRLAARHAVSSREVGGFPCHTVAPRAGAAGAVVYLHGGAYISEMTRQHWALVSRLADAGVRVEVPSYGLAPEHTHREAYPFLTAVYEQLLADVDASAVTLAGDSAGGGLALGLAQTLGAAGLPQPRRLVLISPWLDLTLGNPGIRAVEARDPWLTPAGVVEAGRAWAGGDDPRDPRLSPVNGPLAGLPAIDVHIGTRDVLLPDVRRLQERAAAEGAHLRVSVCPGAVHIYPLTPTPEGRAAAAAIVDTVSRAPG